MSREQILQEATDVLIAALKHSNFTMSESTTAKEIKGWDSLSHMMIMAAVEKHFGVKFTFMEMVRMTNVGSLIDCIANKLPD